MAQHLSLTRPSVVDTSLGVSMCPSPTLSTPTQRLSSQRRIFRKVWKMPSMVGVVNGWGEPGSRLD